jgi:hypothetical protein
MALRELKTRLPHTIPETGWIVGTVTGRAVWSVCATRYHEKPAAKRAMTAAKSRSKR